MIDELKAARIELATALRERDEARALAEKESRDADEWAAAAKKLGEECVAVGRRADKAESERDALRGALDGLVKRLDFVHADASYQAVWTLHQIHGGPYRGPTYTTALELARAALAGGGDRG